MTELPQLPQPRCIHLQSKSMAVHGEGFEDNPDSSGGHFWCVQTARPLGPDGDAVGMKECCDPERGCYQEY
jgi:hypothetical protein